MEDPSSSVLIDMILATFGNGETFTKAADMMETFASTGWYAPYEKWKKKDPPRTACFTVALRKTAVDFSN
jgi:hypothetical protein